jgi:hypothetical protein
VSRVTLVNTYEGTRTNDFIEESDHVHSFLHSYCRLAAFHMACHEIHMSVMETSKSSITPKAQYSHPNSEVIDSLRLGGTGLDEYNVAVLDNVVLALGHDLALRLEGSFITLFFQCVVVVYDTLNECLLKVAVDDTSSLWRLGTSPYCPLPDLVGTCCEEAAELEGFAHDSDGLGKCRLGAEVLELLSSLCVRHDS